MIARDSNGKAYRVVGSMADVTHERQASESQEARQARLDLQFRQLSLIQPDVMLLQEVNPLPEMAEQ